MSLHHASAYWKDDCDLTIRDESPPFVKLVYSCVCTSLSKHVGVCVA